MSNSKTTTLDSVPIDGLAKHLINSIHNLNGGELTVNTMKKILRGWYNEPLTKEPTKLKIKIADPQRRYLVATVNGQKYYEPFHALTKEEKENAEHALAAEEKDAGSAKDENAEILDIVKEVRVLKALLIDTNLGVYHEDSEEGVFTGDLRIDDVNIVAKKPSPESGYLKSDKLINTIINISHSPLDFIYHSFEDVTGRPENIVSATFSTKAKELSNIHLDGKQKGLFELGRYSFEIGTLKSPKRSKKYSWLFRGDKKLIPVLEDTYNTKFVIR